MKEGGVPGGNEHSLERTQKRTEWLESWAWGEWCVLKLERCPGVTDAGPSTPLGILLSILRAERNHHRVERVICSDLLGDKLKGVEQSWLAPELVHARGDGRFSRRAVRAKSYREINGYQSCVEANLAGGFGDIGCIWG